MKIEKYEKITIIITIILAVIAVLCNFKNLNMKKNLKNSKIIVAKINEKEEKTLPKNIKNISIKYKSYENLFTSNKKVFTYGYFKYSKKPFEDGIKYHKNLQKTLSKNNLNYDIVAFENWIDYDKTIDKNNVNLRNKNNQTCAFENSSINELETLRNIAKNCLTNACIIDIKNNKYILMTRSPEFLINILKEYNDK